MPSVVTANNLRSGAVVYLAANGRWIASLANAAVADTPAQITAFENIARAAVEDRDITAVYAFDVRIVDGKPTPTSVRETIRAANSTPLVIPA